MCLKLVAGLLTAMLGAGFAISGAVGGFPISARALWQHSRADHAGVELIARSHL